MINLDQVKLLETKVFKAIDYIELLSTENSTLRQKEAELLEKVGSFQKQIDELEELVMHFKEDQNRIEDSILSALDRLSQFEEAIEKSLRTNPSEIANNAASTQSAERNESKIPSHETD